MKKVFLMLLIALTANSVFSQNEKYTKAMEALLPAVDTTRDREALFTLANSFERIANAEKTQWLPFYYASLANINAAYSYADGGFGDKSAQIDPLADKAEELLNKADALQKDNTEIWKSIEKAVESLAAGELAECPRMASITPHSAVGTASRTVPLIVAVAL